MKSEKGDGDVWSIIGVLIVVLFFAGVYSGVKEAYKARVSEEYLSTMCGETPKAVCRENYQNLLDADIKELEMLNKLNPMTNEQFERWQFLTNQISWLTKGRP